MNEMISYLCYSAKNTEKALSKVCKILKSQNKLNGAYSMFAVGTVISLALAANVMEKQARKINKLEKKLDELTVPTRGE